LSEKQNIFSPSPLNEFENILFWLNNFSLLILILLNHSRNPQLTVVLVTTANGLLAQQNVMEENNLEPDSVIALLLNMGDKTV
jgi:hypothetical protein